MTPSRKINYLEALWRRKWLVLPFVILGAAAGFGAFTQMTPLYRASAVLRYVPQTLSSSVLPNPADSRRGPPNRVQEMRRFIDNIEFLTKVADKAGLENPSREDKIDLRDRFEIIKLNLENYRFTFIDRDPVLAADLSNIFADVFIEAYHDRKHGQTSTSIKFVHDEIGRHESQLAGIRQQLTTYREEHKGALPSDRPANQAELVFLRGSIADLDKEIERVEMERDTRLEMLRTNSGDVPPALGSQDPRVNQLTTLRQQLSDAQLRYTDTHPEVVRLKTNIQTLRQRIQSEPFTAVDMPAPVPQTVDGGGEEPGENDGFRTYVQGEVKSLDARLVELRSEKSTAGNRVAAVENLLAQSLANQAEIESIDSQIRVVQNRLTQKQTQLQGLESELEVVDRAMYERYEIRASAGVPLLPFRPDIFQLTLIGLLGGLAAGVAVALLRELSDKRIYSAEEIESLLDVEIIANVERFQMSRPRKGQRAPGNARDRAAHG